MRSHDLDFPLLGADFDGAEFSLSALAAIDQDGKDVLVFESAVELVQGRGERHRRAQFISEGLASGILGDLNHLALGDLAAKRDGSSETAHGQGVDVEAGLLYLLDGIVEVWVYITRVERVIA